MYAVFFNSFGESKKDLTSLNARCWNSSDRPGAFVSTINPNSDKAYLRSLKNLSGLDSFSSQSTSGSCKLASFITADLFFSIFPMRVFYSIHYLFLILL